MYCRFDLYTESLDISNNRLTSLSKTSLSGMGVISLTELNASRNYIGDIHEEAFVGQSRLQTLDLSSNSVTYIEPKTFIRNPYLEKLSLSGNQRLILPEEGSFLQSASLRVLHLSACNLSHIPPKAFQSLPNLQELYISHNSIEAVFPLQSSARLTVLDVSNNYLTGVDPDIFTSSPKLNHLNLSYNRLRTLDVELMSHLAGIITASELNGNPWVCDCVLFNTTYSWCRYNGVNLRLMCSSPPNFQGKPWTVYDKEGCGDNTDYVDEVEQFSVIPDTLLRPRRMHENYGIRQMPTYVSIQSQEQDVDHNDIYFYTSLGVLALLLCLLSAAGVLQWRTHRTLKRTSREQSAAI